VVAAIGEGLCVVKPDGGHEYVEMPDRFTTNICFGGDDLRTAYVTLSGGGRIVACEWPRPGLQLAF
jgi:gluconolactonase